MWRHLSGPVGVASFPEYIKLAKSALTRWGLGGSVEEERTFSAMNLIKSLTRNRLQENHLNHTVRAMTTRGLFPPNSQVPTPPPLRRRSTSGPRNAAAARF
jgi:hypothetical protein